MVKNVYSIDTCKLVKKPDYNSKIGEIEGEIPDISNLATNISVNAKMNEVKVEIPNVNDLVLKVDYDAKYQEKNILLLLIIINLRIIYLI